MLYTEKIFLLPWIYIIKGVASHLLKLALATDLSHYATWLLVELSCDGINRRCGI